MDEQYSIKSGRIEGVMWIVLKNRKFLVEKRPEEAYGAKVCIPAGHIDLNRDVGEDYIQKAFLRESQEEFIGGKFVPIEYSYLASIKFEEKNHAGETIKLLLHYFVVTEWAGKVPEYTVEHEKKHSDLIWFPLAGFKRLPQSCDREAIKLMIKNVEKKRDI